MSNPRLSTLEVLFTPADFAALKQRDLRRTTCVVFDVLRATSSMVAALGNGADAILPVAEIPEALALRTRDPSVLLAGERDGVRITADLSGGPPFDLGNSPREFTPEVVRGKRIVMTTTNGTRALRACALAERVLVASFLNLRATGQALDRTSSEHLLVICSGTFEETAYEDVLGAGALCNSLWTQYASGRVADSAQIARTLYLLERQDLTAAFARARNGQRLLSRPELRDDVAFCARLDAVELVAELAMDGMVRAVAAS
jgi:2-phosphosulfolactate phosphatase